MIKRLILLLTVSIVMLPVFSASALAADPVTVRVGIYENEPKYFTDTNGTTSGFWADITNYIAFQEGWVIEYVPGTWEECLNRLETGEIDMMPDVAWSEERNQIFHFSEEPVYLSWSSVYIPQGSSLQSVLDLEGRKIAVLQNSINVVGPEGIQHLVEDFSVNCTFVQADSYQQAFEMVKSGTADAAVASKDFALLHEDEYGLESTPILFSPVSLNYAFPKTSAFGKYLSERVDYNVVQLKADHHSVLYQAMEKWLGIQPDQDKGMPAWLIWLLVGIGGVTLLLTAGGVILRSQVKSRTRDLVREIERREQVELYNDNLNSILLALRNVNQLIVREPDRVTLISQACEMLVETRGFSCAWILLLDNAGKYNLAASAGIDETSGFLRNLSEDIYPPCVHNFIGNNLEFTICSDIVDTGRRCSIRDMYPHGEGLISLLKHEDVVYGLLFVYVPKEFARDTDEKSLLVELAGDIAYALHNIDDAEEQEKAEEQIENLAKFLDENPNPVLRIAFDGTVLYANKGAGILLDYWGINEGEKVTGYCCDLVDRAVSEGKIIEEEHEIGERVFLYNIVPVPSAGYTNIYVNDVTQRRQVEDELRQSESKLSATFDSIPQGIIVTDMGGTILQVNRSAIAIYGCESETEILGKNGLDFTDEAYRQAILDAVTRASVEGGKTSFRYIARKPDGDEFPAEMSVAPIINLSGETIGMVGLFEDITEQLQMQENLMVTDRLASVGELAAGIAHELNNPLTGVIGFSDLLMSRDDIPDQVKEDLSIINREALRASQVARHLLTFARKHPDEKHTVELNQVIQVVLELRAYEQRVNNIEVVTNFDDDLPDVLANDYQLQQVIINIVINAEHFMIEAHKGGKLEVTTETVGDKVRVIIADDGPGIEPEVVGRIFDPFFTTKEVGKGTGLGLSICYGIVTEHGGRIWVESETDHGARFIIELPVENDPST